MDYRTFAMGVVVGVRWVTLVETERFWSKDPRRRLRDLVRIYPKFLRFKNRLYTQEELSALCVNNYHPNHESRKSTKPTNYSRVSPYPVSFQLFITVKFLYIGSIPGE